MISSILWPHFPANHIDGKNPAAYSSVLSHSWPQNQISHVGGWAKGMSWQIPTEVDSCPSPSPLPLKSPKKRKLEAPSFKKPLNREGNGTPLKYSWLENPMDRGAWQAAVHGVTKSRTQLNNFTFTFHFHALEKEMATHASVLAWRIPGTGETGGLPSMGSHRVGHDWSNLAAAAAVDTISWIYIQAS